MDSFYASSPAISALPAAAFAPVVLTRDEAHALMTGLFGRSQPRRFYPIDQLRPITGHTGEHELLPVDSAALRAGKESRLTFMLRKLPRHLTAEQVRDRVMEITPIVNTFDLLYVPVYNGKQGNNRGYCFVNFVSVEGAATFAELLALRNVPDDLIPCELVFAHVQGKANMLRRLNESVNSKKALPGLPFEF
jgi:hypothetical protein